MRAEGNGVWAVEAEAETEKAEVDIHVDRSRPPRMTFADTGGEPILAFQDDGEACWTLHVQHYQPFRMRSTAFGCVSEALAQARALLAMPLPVALRLPGRRVNLRSQHCADGDSYFLDATLERNGSLTLSGQDLGHHDYEYEYWYIVEAANVPAMVIALGGEPGADIIDLLVSQWSGDAVAELIATIKRSGVEYKFCNYF